MSHVVITAQKYRNRLNAELARVEDFLRFAELMKEMSDRESVLLPRAAMVASAAAADDRPQSEPSEPDAATPAETATAPEAAQAAGVAPATAAPKPAPQTEASRSSGFRSLFHGVLPGAGDERQTA